jgi:hypothetical protein
MSEQASTSLFHTITEKRQHAAHILSRILYGVCASKSLLEAGGTLRGLVKELAQGQASGRELGGRVMDHVNFALAIVEGSSEAVNRHMQLLYEATCQGRLQAVSVVVATNDNPDCYFPDWRNYEDMAWPLEPEPASL